MAYSYTDTELEKIIITYETLFLFYYVKFVYQICLCVTKKKYIMYKDQDY